MRQLRMATLFLAACLTACAALFPKPEPPRLSVADLRLLSVGLLEQRYQLRLRVQNPNRFDIAVEGLDYELFVNDAPFATGVGDKPVTIPGYGTEVVEVEGFGNLADTLFQLLDPRKGVPDKLRYRLKGTVRLARGPSRLPFDHSGEISFGLGRSSSSGT